MQVTKCNGTRESVSFDKILRRIGNLCKKLNLDRINIVEVAKDTINGLFDGITTEEIDHFASISCAGKIGDDPQYDRLAVGICVSRLHKTTSNDFMQVVNKLYFNEDPQGNINPLLSSECYKTICDNIDVIQKTLDESYIRDYDFGFFGFKTLERAYLNRVKIGETETNTGQSSKQNKEKQVKSRFGNIVERPQHMLMRLAVGLNDDIDDALELFHYLSNRCCIFGSPTIYNCGKPRAQMSSCFLLYMQDSIEGIYDTVKESALISKDAGGIGIYVGALRANGSIIRGTNGISSGPIPFVQELNWTARAVNQAGRRNGAISVYIEPWHADIFRFCELRSNKGNEEDKARDIFLALWIPDLFMKRVEQDSHWSLMCPDECKGLTESYGDEFEELYIKYEQEGKYKKQIRAKELWFHILTSQIETGMPYMLYKDHINRKSNQKNIGTIKSSNLCVSGDTYILTGQGQIQIKELVGQMVTIWNGEEWTNVEVMQTGINKRLIKVTTSNGLALKCTPEHKFYVENNGKIAQVPAKELQINDVLIKYKLPFNNIYCSTNTIDSPYTQGVFAMSGVCNMVTPLKMYLHCNLREIVKYLHYQKVKIVNSYIDIRLYDTLKDKYFVPLNHTLDVTLKWFAGVCDLGGCIKDDTLQIKSQNKQFLTNTLLMLQNIGIKSYIEMSLGMYTLKITCSKLTKLQNMGFKTHLLKIPSTNGKMARKQVTVSGIKLSSKEDTYCFTEPKRHMGMFNGILTGQCSEIVQYTSETETAVCNLSSICLPRFLYKDENDNYKFDYEKLRHVAGLLTKNLNNVIDKNSYPSEKAKRSNMRHRPIGVGVQGLADVYCMMKLPFDSEEARLLNKLIFENIYYGALKMSIELAKKYGPYESYYDNGGSPYSKGQLQFHLWGINEKDLLAGLDWETLISDLQRYGSRNSLLTTVMPTASTSQIMGNTESIEPIASNVYTRTTLAGEFTVVNKHLVEELIKLGIWNKELRDELIYDKGSVQDIEAIPEHIKAIYKTAFEIKNRPIVQQSIDRGPFIEQSQSLNLFCKVPDFTMLTSSHFFGWRNGLKTGLYYLKTQPAVNPIDFGVDADTIKQIIKRRNIAKGVCLDTNEIDENGTNEHNPRLVNEIEMNHGNRQRFNKSTDLDPCSSGACGA